MRAGAISIAFVCAMITFAGCSWQWKCGTGRRSKIAGSYQVMVCGGPCSFEGSGDIIVKGFMVLLDQPMSHEQSEYLLTHWNPGTYLTSQNYSKQTGCFVLDKKQQNRDCFAGIVPHDFTFWCENQFSDAITFLLYRSPDGSYQVVGYFTGGLFQGEGQSLHNFWSGPRHRVMARRISAPDITLCVQ
jgi:hypothetical protein